MSPRKLGRNEKCWCGSGKKFKNCHLDRENQTQISPWEMAKELRRAYSAKLCLAPKKFQESCSNKIARAHTVPKSESLRQIARDGHIYSFVPSFENFKKNNGLIVPELCGVNKASTFTGFCTNHDDALFGPIEKQNFVGKPEQCFLLAYRALARETYTKSAAIKNSDIHRDADKGKPLLLQQRIQEFLRLHRIGLEAGIKNVRRYKDKFDEMLEGEDYSPLKSYVVEISDAPDVMCSGCIYPDRDFVGNKLQEISDISNFPDMIAVSAFCSGDLGFIVFSWLEEFSESPERFIQTLEDLEQEAKTGAILRFVFESIENVHMRPDWWEALPSETREATIRRMTDSANPMIPRSYEVLTDDGVFYPPWDIKKTYLV